MKRKKLIAVLSAALVLVLLLALLAGCGKKDAPAETPEPAEPTETVESAEPTAAETDAARQDGERFEATIVIEGMEETVKYEHIRNDAMGFEMDYDYENFVRQSEPGVERFVSVYDDPENPENYLEVRFNPQGTNTVADGIGAALSASYEIYREDAFALDGVGQCIRIDASADVGGKTMPEQLQAVYILSAPDGCRVATAHYAIVGSEGFGVRFRSMMNTFLVTDAHGDNRLSDEEALSAIEHCCYAGNPDLKGIVDAGEYPVSWSVDAGDDAQIVVLFRSYTGAEIRYHIDRASGETYVTELVPNVSSEETRTDETPNAWDYSF